LPKSQDNLSEAGMHNRQGRRAKKACGGGAPPRDVKNEDRSGNVYENKGQEDNLPDAKDDICAWLNTILHKNTRILPELLALLQLLGIGEATRYFKM